MTHLYPISKKNPFNHASAASSMECCTTYHSIFSPVCRLAGVSSLGVGYGRVGEGAGGGLAGAVLPAGGGASGVWRRARARLGLW